MAKFLVERIVDMSQEKIQEAVVAVSATPHNKPLPPVGSKKDVSDHPHPPLGNLLLRTMTLPRDTTPAGDIFGGWIMSQLDIAGAILAREIAHGRVVTVAVDAMNFLKPVEVGDVVCCYGHCIKVGRTSLKISLELWVKKIYEHTETTRDLVTEACFTYVAVGDDGRPRPLPPEAHIIAEKGIDAGTVGLQADGSIKKPDCC